MLRRVLLTVGLTALAVAGGGATALATSRACPPGSTTAGCSGGAAPTGPGSTTTAATTAAVTATTPAITAGGAVSPTSATSVTSGAVVISGHGWGHGVGMAQWGAYGYAQHGWTYDRILEHYYTGTTIERRPTPTIRVLLLEGATRATLASAGPWSVTDATGKKVKLPAGTRSVGRPFTAGGKKLVLPLSFAGGRLPLSLGGKQYRGKLVVLVDGKKLQVVNALKLEAYVEGVVGYEMPHTWPAAALQAQAVAARSYALSTLSRVVTARAYDVRPDTSDQVYGGVAAETPEVSAAVEATRGMAVLYKGKVVTTYYSSSSGGRTSSAAETFGSTVPYLVPVADPYDTVSPYHDWGPVVYDEASFARVLRVGSTLDALDVVRGASGRVATLSASGPAGQANLTGPAMRTLLGLRSTFFTIGRLSLDQPEAVVYGTKAEIDGVASDVGPVVLEGRSEGVDWRPVAKVKPDARGAFTVFVSPEAPTEYRLAAGAVRAGLASVSVEPTIAAAIAAGAVQGIVKPPLSGAVVQVQRHRAGSWITVASSKTDASGGFWLAAPAAAGSYRVLCSPGHGFEPGVSSLLAVQ